MLKSKGKANIAGSAISCNDTVQTPSMVIGESSNVKARFNSVGSCKKETVKPNYRGKTTGKVIDAVKRISKVKETINVTDTLKAKSRRSVKGIIRNDGILTGRIKEKGANTSCLVESSS